MTWDGRIRADARQLPIADETVQCVVTSPPYWGLRDYKNDGQIGLERTPVEYVDSIREVFAELWRVLKRDGVAWLNLGDSYIGSGMTGGTGSKEASDRRVDRMFHGNRRDTVAGFKQKDLAGIPWRVAFALQADGWYLRSDIIWSKPNPMPESVTDRPTKAHEYIFLLTKSERYYYDSDAIAEQSAYPDGPNSPQSIKSPHGQGFTRSAHMEGTQRNDGERWRLADGGVAPRGTRNKRSVWTLATKPYAEAHYATFPEEIPEICIKAGSRPGDLILDPFAGSNTTGRVAERLSRR